MARPMTMAEKILAAHAGLDEVEPGQLIECDLDLVLANDVTAPIAIKEFNKIGVERVFDPEKIALVPDHYVPNKDIKSAEQAKIVRDFARAQGIGHYYEVGCMGVEHALLPEQGVVGAGDLVIGADSHTCTYGALGAFTTGVGSTDAGVGMATGKAWFKVPESLLFKIDGELAPGVTGKDVILHIIGLIGVDGALYQAMEFTGSAIANMGMDERMSISNMAIEAGGKAGLIPVDDVTRAYLDGRTERPYTEYHSDPDAVYAKVYEIDAADIRPTVAFPHLPSNTRPAAEAHDVTIDQAVIGSCTNGRITDMRQAADVLRGRKVADSVRCIVIPATQLVYRQCMEEGLMEVFLDANCAVSTPTCGPCLGGYMGILAAGERAIATTNRNFVGRMGDPTSEVYLASPAVAAASAVLGYIGTPDDLEPVAAGAADAE
ncbi:3-isopropylmalate dehydratase large subunit [Xiamenia xianingshaonis]|uniref:3-isopropylmalate dehydratase large subunit n=1 Tax=Xiamenia xianingshaonis TaxID=2682776 RepID=A0A9E6SUH6_9ACTN|nr:3-isopropylmalate dehydratase large subunit [Xiamenia xianingshaonis]NHM13419.1 3-isopropylmalate dehydratase large subunit [Xiamenia xianingshaonis]QTU84501.1 3-isopropylmalate dehydratase large subunit [Xiamenia xianingshaonis]